MSQFIEITSQSEKLYESKKNSKRAVMAISRLTAAGELAGILPLAEGSREVYLEKAARIAISRYNHDVCNISMLLWAIYTYVKTGKLKAAEEYLDKLNQYKTYFKTHEKRNYFFITFLRTEIEFAKGKIRGSKKQFKILKTMADEEGDQEMYTLVAYAHACIYGEYKEAEQYILKSFTKGSRSWYLYYSMYQVLQNGKTDKTPFLLSKCIPWAVSHDLPLDDMIVSLKEQWEISFSQFEWNVGNIERLFKKYPFDFILKHLCLGLIRLSDRSQKAHQYYRLARERQIASKELDDLILLSAYENGVEGLPLFTLESVLANPVSHDDILAYVYHLLLTSGDYKYLLERTMEHIIEFGRRMFAENKTGKYYNSIYKALYDATKNGAVLISLFEHLFSYEISFENPQIKYFWVYEKNKKDIKVYNASKNSISIQAADDNFTLYPLGARQKKIYTGESVKINKAVQNADLALLEACWENGLVNTNLLIALSERYINGEQLSPHALAVLKQTIDTNEISFLFKNEISARLGSHYAEEKEFEKAFLYYSVVETECLRPSDYDNCIKSLAHAGDIEQALSKMLTRYEGVRPKTLFFICKEAFKNELYHEQIAPVCYKLIIKSWFDKELLGVVIRHYEGALEDFTYLRKIVDEQGLSTESVDKKIIDRALETHTFTMGFQIAFQSYYEKKPASERVQYAAYYTVYEILKHRPPIDGSLLKTLEQIYLRDPDNNLLLYAIASVYIYQKMETINRKEILSRCQDVMEKNEILLDVFKDSVDKNIPLAYIKKNIPFVFHGSKNKDVFVYYQINGGAYQKKPLIYIKFGIYSSYQTLFFGEEIKFYYAYEENGQTIRTPETSVIFANSGLQDKNSFYAYINNALILQHAEQFDNVENLITEKMNKEKKYFIKQKIL